MNRPTHEQSLMVISGLGDSACPHNAGNDQPMSVLKLDQHAYDRALDCVHCGLCLPACPTYTTNGLEADSPRGRIHLMKALADGKVSPTESVRKHLDLCLDCRACETACPSGVVYHELLHDTRTKLPAATKRTLTDRLVEAMFLHVFTQPARLKLALLPARLLQRVGVWGLLKKVKLPEKLAQMRQMLPEDGPMWEQPLAGRYPSTSPDGKTHHRVAFFAGCVGSVLFQEVNRQSIALLQRTGCEVIVPSVQGCCGAIHHHSAREHEARQLALANLRAFMAVDGGGNTTKTSQSISTTHVKSNLHEVDMIITSIAGCGAMLKEYDHLLRDDAEHDRAEQFTRKVRDISQALYELGLSSQKPACEIKATATYHDACHLAHAQKITDAPRALLAAIPGLKLISLPEADMCCGAAGTYNLTQPVMSQQLAERKLQMIGQTGASICITGNVGCAMQIDAQARRMNMKLDVVHPVTLLYRVYCEGR